VALVYIDTASFFEDLIGLGGGETFSLRTFPFFGGDFEAAAAFSGAER